VYRFRLTLLGLSAALLGASTMAGTALAAVPLGPEFQVNTYTTDNQFVPSVAVDMFGNFVVVWDSEGSGAHPPVRDKDGRGILGQRYDATGNAIGVEFQVNSYTTNNQIYPTVAMNAGGEFVVAWHSTGSAGTDTDGDSVHAQRYDANGDAVGTEFQVNTYTTFRQRFPWVSLDADGAFVVVWTSIGSSGTDSSGYSVQAQRYDSSGSAVGSEFQVNTYTTSDQRIPSIAADADGNFVVVWHSNGSAGGDTSLNSIHGQRYDASGSAVGSEFQVNSYTTLNQLFASVAVDTDGDFAVTWHSLGSSGSDTSSDSVQAQLYDANGNTVGAEFQVNTYTTNSQALPRAVYDPDGGFMIVWESFGSGDDDSSANSIQGQRYDALGNPVGGEFQANSYTTSSQGFPSIAANADGDFVMAWYSDGSSGDDTSGFSTQARIFIPEPSAFLVLAAGVAFLATAGRRRTRG
jgi:hypothetical protein